MPVTKTVKAVSATMALAKYADSHGFRDWHVISGKEENEYKLVNNYNVAGVSFTVVSI